MDISLTDKYTVSSGFVLRNIVGEFLLIPVDPNHGVCRSIISINETTAFVINLIKDGACVGDIVDCFLEEYDVSYEQAKDDIIEVLSTLKNLGVLLL